MPLCDYMHGDVGAYRRIYIIIWSKVLIPWIYCLYLCQIMKMSNQISDPFQTAPNILAIYQRFRAWIIHSLIMFDLLNKTQ